MTEEEVRELAIRLNGRREELGVVCRGVLGLPLRMKRTESYQVVSGEVVDRGSI